jgi:hypothetical protein
MHEIISHHLSIRKIYVDIIWNWKAKDDLEQLLEIFAIQFM